jgi:hypothetical protein
MCAECLDGLLEAEESLSRLHEIFVDGPRDWTITADPPHGVERGRGEKFAELRRPVRRKTGSSILFNTASRLYTTTERMCTPPFGLPSGVAAHLCSVLVLVSIPCGFGACLPAISTCLTAMSAR